MSFALWTRNLLHTSKHLISSGVATETILCFCILSSLQQHSGKIHIAASVPQLKMSLLDHIKHFHYLRSHFFKY